MDPKRADPLDIDLSGFGPAPPAKPKVETAAVRQVSEANDFLSRAPARKPKVVRRRRTGRNVQLNVKATAQTIPIPDAAGEAQLIPATWRCGSSGSIDFELFRKIAVLA
jgi:hypothetical protein